jgi:hypothetical protein
MSLSNLFLRPFTRGIVLPLLAVVLAAAPLAAQTKLDPEATFKSMLDAVRWNSYEKFTAHADATFKARFTEKMFAEMTRQLGPKLEHGYKTTFLTTLNQGPYVAYVWKLSFSSGKDDYLMTMFTKGDAVSGLVTR